MKALKIPFWRGPYDILSCWGVIFIAIYLVVAVSAWFYPLSLLLIANRILALSLLCHEGLHGNLSRNKKWNDFLGRYLCAFPSFISFSKYRRVHILHHSGVGSEQWDPDRHLYNFFPMNLKTYLWLQLKDLVTLRTAWSFIRYYTDIADLIAIARGKKSYQQLNKYSDWKGFILFSLALNATTLYFGVWLYTQAFTLVPLILITQPYVLLIGGLQHGPVRTKNTPEGVSRTITGSKLYMWMLLPVDINYHAEHHLNPSVPHYHLKEYSAQLNQNGRQLWSESYWSAIKELFLNNKAYALGDNLEPLQRFEIPSAAKKAVLQENHM